jgi:predicted  nucleic acid-binding Zn-ribbon protein
MAVQKSPPPLSEEDLEATVELPPMDLGTTAVLRPELVVATDRFRIPTIPPGTSQLTQRLSEAELRLREMLERMQGLEAELAAAQARSDALEAQLADSQRELETARGELDSAHAQLLQQRAALGESQREMEQQALVRRHHAHELAELRRRGERQHEALTTWQGYRAISESLLDEADEDLRVAGVRHRTEVSRLQAQLAARDAELVGLRERFARTQEPPVSPGRTSSRFQALPATSGPAAQRVLVWQEGGAEVVHPLGRHTTIGSTPDNDIQVDAPQVSGHHAVLLSNDDHCIVEDLNSAGGVLVNGHRVGRQILQDGDAMAIGTTEFRYQQRS